MILTAPLQLVLFEAVVVVVVSLLFASERLFLLLKLLDRSLCEDLEELVRLIRWRAPSAGAIKCLKHRELGATALEI